VQYLLNLYAVPLFDTCLRCATIFCTECSTRFTTENETANHTVCGRGKHFLWPEQSNYTIDQCGSLNKVPTLTNYKNR